MLDDFKADLGRLRRYGSRESTLRLLLFNQGIWACACYRAGRWLNDHRPPPGIRQVVMFGYHLWWKWIETHTGHLDFARLPHRPWACTSGTSARSSCTRTW